ncbi:hypothetical protein K7432_010168 [Basidiobolus ranarum]|uniref:Fucosyltransferase n=1 Tax=Basidiobolus ranarum TaxID=34480 RepID=A0ABR2VWP5_9FUNG
MVRELQKYIKIDIYGNYAPFRNKAWPGDDDIHQVISKYKFYLALENSSCDEFVSEKFWNSLLSTTVPVVDGPDDYSMYAPTNHSIIKIDEFGNLQALAQRLLYLANNDTAYKEYFSYKFGEPLSENFTNTWVNKDYSERSAMCKMCKTLHDNDTRGNGVEGWLSNHRILEVDNTCHVGKWEQYRFTFYTSGWFVWIWPLVAILIVISLLLIKKYWRLMKCERECFTTLPWYTPLRNPTTTELDSYDCEQ